MHHGLLREGEERWAGGVCAWGSNCKFAAKFHMVL